MEIPGPQHTHTADVHRHPNMHVDTQICLLKHMDRCMWTLTHKHTTAGTLVLTCTHTLKILSSPEKDDQWGEWERECMCSLRKHTVRG